MTAAPARRRRALARAAAIAACVGAFAAACDPAPAATGDLHVHSGTLPDGAPVAVGPWSGLTHNAPGGSGTYGVTMPHVGQGWAQTATLSAPAGLTFRSATVAWRAGLPVSADHSQPQAETTWVNRGWPHAGRSSSGGYLGDTAGGTDTATNPGHLSIRVACVGFDGTPGTCGGGSFLIDRGEFVLHDDDAPSIAGPMTGPLLDGGWQTAPSASVTFTASDVGSGVYRAFVRSGSQTFYALADTAATRCRDARPSNATPYDFVASALTLVPCTTGSATYTPTFDLTALGDGVHLVSLGIEDAGGNERTVLTNRTLRVNTPGGALADPGTPCPGGTSDASGTCQPSSGAAPGGGGGAGGAGGVTPVAPRGPSSGGDPVAPTPPPPPTASAAADGPRANGEGASAAASLALRIDGQSRGRVTVPYGRPVTVGGRLTRRGGAPIAGATIELTAIARGAEMPQPAVVTQADGTFRATLAPGPSRTLRFAYRAFAGDADHADTAEIELAVRSAVRLRAVPQTLRNGDAVTFRGRVAGAPAGSRKVVEMQVLQEGRWLTFGTTRLRHGRFSYRYRFTRTVRPTRYAFRTVVRTDAAWPYETGASKSATVQVRP